MEVLMGTLQDIRTRAEQMIQESQKSICRAIEAIDGKLVEDCWTSADGNTHYTDHVLRQGRVFQMVSVNVAAVHSTFSPETARAATGGCLQVRDPLPFYVASLSIVAHGQNPMVPSAHAHYRYFEVDGGATSNLWWFGGGADLTPNYLFEEDVVHFHRIHRQVCDRYDTSYYQRFKKSCDEYFHIVHRGERRGVGGIFFDNLNDHDPSTLLAFVAECIAVFVPAYLPIVEKRQNKPFTESHERWRQLRAGRYVEFNLLYERGTAFGLRSGGRPASILMGLPERARWEYQHAPLADSAEAKLVEVLQNPREWV
jgi:coproporphyrinogen III oxidase